MSDRSIEGVPINQSSPKRPCLQMGMDCCRVRGQTRESHTSCQARSPGNAGVLRATTDNSSHINRSFAVIGTKPWERSVWSPSLARFSPPKSGSLLKFSETDTSTGASSRFSATLNARSLSSTIFQVWSRMRPRPGATIRRLIRFALARRKVSVESRTPKFPMREPSVPTAESMTSRSSNSRRAVLFRGWQRRGRAGSRLTTSKS